jgi:type II secretory pathway pseudopilin PulG
MNRRGRNNQSGISLIELLISMVILTIVSTMILGTWFALSRSYAHTVRSDKQIDTARDAISRMSREIRDAQGVLGTTDVPVPFVRTYADEIRFYSTYNAAGAWNPLSPPQLTRYMYRVTNAAQGTGNIYREYAGANGTFDSTDPSVVVATDVANSREGQDVFTYMAYNHSTGQPYYSDGTATLIAPADMVSVGISLLVDLNPGKSPNYTDVSTTVNPRNIRQL